MSYSTWKLEVFTSGYWQTRYIRVGYVVLWLFESQWLSTQRPPTAGPPITQSRLVVDQFRLLTGRARIRAARRGPWQGTFCTSFLLLGLWVSLHMQGPSSPPLSPPQKNIQAWSFHRKQLFPQELSGLFPIADTAGQQLPGRYVTNFHFIRIHRKIDDFLPFITLDDNLKGRFMHP